MSDHQDDLDLLLSLQDRVLETPPASPSSHSPAYLSDDGSPTRREKANMSVFKNAVQDCLENEPKANKKPAKSNRQGIPNDAEVEKFSGLRIRNQLLTSAELRERFSDIRFVRLSVIKNLLIGDAFSGCWATVGVLTEKGSPKTSSTGKSYCIWKIGCLDESTVSLFLFGDAYKRNSQEHAGEVFALFNCAVRKDGSGNGFSLSAYTPNQILKMGTSADYGVCKGKRKDGMACTLVINKRKGIYCKFHKSNVSEKYSTMRTELKGGPSRDYLQSEGIYLVDPLANKTNTKKSQPLKLLSVDALKKALSNADKVTTKMHSQGIRFLSEVTGNQDPKSMDRRPMMPNEQSKSKDKRRVVNLKSSSVGVGSPAIIRNQHLDAKRIKTEGQALADKTKKGSEKMIELDLVSSDEDI
ncbi:protein MCM10-like protein [Senna tora]|uniref:Protein MCM10-like protein n=1 Tax=Senna tora TaxID=362788 RepID=A0A834XA25_9FABA|nr:protein MCM10-like protein [Senna tora]